MFFPGDASKYRTYFFKTIIMKARLLKKILNDTSYTVAFYDKYIGIGSPLCHDLIKLELETRKITYALDTGRKGREAILHHEELTFIWDKLHELVDNGRMADIVNGNDVIENPLPVYTVRRGVLICTTTDAYGWPNVTVDGYMMHDNDYFKTAAEALDYGIKEYEYRVKTMEERIVEVEIELDRLNQHKREYSNVVAGLKLLNPAQGNGPLNTMNIYDPKEGQAADQQATGTEEVKTETANEQATEGQEGETTEG
jgi:hypothetical protein